MECLAFHYGLTGPSCVKEFLKSQDDIDFENLIENGSNVTIQEFLKIKKKYDKWPQEKRDKLIADRDTFNQYKGDTDNESSSEEDSSDDDDSNSDSGSNNQAKSESSD